MSILYWTKFVYPMSVFTLGKVLTSQVTLYKINQMSLIAFLQDDHLHYKKLNLSIII